MQKFSKTQIDKLGDRLRKGQISEEDLKMLDEYRKSYSPAYDEVVGVIKEKLKLNASGRPAKSTTSIIDKLNRESIRLSQVQDIAGCRLIVSNIKEQDKTVANLANVFSAVSIVDRRAKPSHGYRAVHIVVRILRKPIEVQIRTELQHQWAELSEKFSDIVDPLIKYGKGDWWDRLSLKLVSEMIKLTEILEGNSSDRLSNKMEMQKIILKQIIGMYANTLKFIQLFERKI